MNSIYATENELERQRLFEVTAKLTDKDLSRQLPNGWSVATKLAHLAYWDRYYISLIDDWERTGFTASRVNVDAINEAVRVLRRAIPPKDVIPLVRDAAEAIDQKLKTLTPELASVIESEGYARILHRALHRRQHLDQIEEVLGRSSPRIERHSPSSQTSPEKTR